MKHTYIFLILIALSSCQLKSKLEDDTFILLSVLNQQTERYKRIISEDFPSLTVIERDSLIVSALINNSDFINNDRLSTEIYSIDTIPGFKLLDSLEIIDITSKTLTKEGLVRLQFKALENAYSKLSFNKFNILNRAKVLVENTKSSYEQSQNDSVKIQLVFYDEYQWFPHNYSFNQKDTLESSYETQDNFIKLDLSKKGVNKLRGSIFFTNGIRYEIPYEYEYFVE